MLMPQVSAHNVVDLMNQCNISNQRTENNQNSGFQTSGNTLKNVPELGEYILLT